jgi:hypothetical protein
MRFWYAAQYGDIEHLKKFLATTPDINKIVFHGGAPLTALMIAIQNRQSHIIPILLAHGADPNIGFPESPITPLLYGISRTPDQVGVLLDYGATAPEISKVANELTDAPLKQLLKEYIDGTTQPTYGGTRIPPLLRKKLEQLSELLNNLLSKLR